MATGASSGESTTRVDRLMTRNRKNVPMNSTRYFCIAAVYLGCRRRHGKTFPQKLLTQPTAFTARDNRTVSITMDTVTCSIMSNLAARLTGTSSVGPKVVEVSKDKYT
jgi:hypothetical protein